MRTEPSLVAPDARVVVVSPHLDDAVLSLGAALATWARAGEVEVLTVFACDPESEAPAGGWDRRGGFATEGESASARREEDARACAALGVAPAWLSFGSLDYERHGTDDDIVKAVSHHIGSGDSALLPAFPLMHPDHEWLARGLVPILSERARLGFYAEQPYTHRARDLPRLPQWSVGLGGSAQFVSVDLSTSARIAKWRAIRAYRSQLPLLALRGVRRGPHTLALGAELVAWPT